MVGRKLDKYLGWNYLRLTINTTGSVSVLRTKHIEPNDRMPNPLRLELECWSRMWYISLFRSDDEDFVFLLLRTIAADPLHRFRNIVYRARRPVLGFSTEVPLASSGSSFSSCDLITTQGYHRKSTTFDQTLAPRSVGAHIWGFGCLKPSRLGNENYILLDLNLPWPHRRLVTDRV